LAAAAHAQPGTSAGRRSLTRELCKFIAEESATEYIGPDRLPPVSTFIADWMANTFADLAAVKH
jgi:hypothetical protein